jgi:hypothetical protein
MGGKLTILGANGTTDGGGGDGGDGDGGGDEGGETPITPTPGFEAVSVLFAMAVILYVWRRRAM